MDISNEELESLKLILISFYGTRISSQIHYGNVNESLIRLIYEMIDEAKICTDSMNFVPQPSDLIMGSSVWKKVVGYLVTVQKRHFNNSTGYKGPYKSCMNKVAANYRTPLGFILNGL